MTCLIKRVASGPAHYYSHQLGRDYGAPQGGWTPDIRRATSFAGHGAAQAFIDEAVPETERAACQITDITTTPRKP